MKKPFLLLLSAFLLLPLFAQNTDDEYEEDMTQDEIATKQFWDGLKQNRYGLRDSKNREILPIIYESIKPIDSTLVAVCFDKKYGVISLTGETVIPFIYDDMIAYNKNLIVVRKGQSWGIINSEQDVIVPLKYGGVKILNGNKKLFLVKDKEKPGSKKKKKWRLVDAAGNKKSPNEYNNIKAISKYGAIVVKNLKRGMIDSIGNQIIPTLYKEIEIYKDIVIVRDSLYGVYDYNGNQLLPVEYFKIKYGITKEGEERLFTVGKDLKWGLVNDRNEILIPIEHYSIGYFNEGVSHVGTKDYKYAIINTRGELITPLEFGFIFTFYNGIAATNKSGKGYGVIDKDGNEVIPFIYQSTSVSTGDKNLIEARLNDKYGMVNRNNEVIIPFEYDYIYSFSNSETTTADKNNKHGLIDKKGNVVLPFEFDIILSYYRDMHVVGVKDKAE